jgi:hypothetical protein
VSLGQARGQSAQHRAVADARSALVTSWAERASDFTGNPVRLHHTKLVLVANGQVIGVMKRHIAKVRA